MSTILEYAHFLIQNTKSALQLSKRIFFYIKTTYEFQKVVYL